MGASATPTFSLHVAVRDALAEAVRLRSEAVKASNLGRHVRELELHERSLAVVEAAVPPDSLVAVSSLIHIYAAITFSVSGPDNKTRAIRAWVGEPRLFDISRRCLRLLDLRWRAGTLFEPTGAEQYFFDVEMLDQPAWSFGACMFVQQARNSIYYWRELHGDEEEERTRFICDAVPVAVELDARLKVVLQMASDELKNTYRQFDVHNLLEVFLDAVLNRDAGMLSRLRGAYGLSREDEAAARRLLHALEQPPGTEAAALAGAHGLCLEDSRDHHADTSRRAAADVARHGLRRCALPACDAQEAHPGHFKKCGACKTVAYCGREHQQQDWPTHKAACQAARAAAPSADA